MNNIVHLPEFTIHGGIKGPQGVAYVVHPQIVQNVDVPRRCKHGGKVPWNVQINLRVIRDKKRSDGVIFRKHPRKHLHPGIVSIEPYFAAGLEPARHNVVGSDFGCVEIGDHRQEARHVSASQGLGEEKGF